MYKPVEPDPDNAGGGRNMRHFVRALLASTAMGLLLVPSAVAQDLTIDVVAPAEPLALDTGRSVVFTDEASERGETRLPELLPFIPNVGSSGGNTSPRFFQIRGIGELEQFVGAPNPSVSLTADGLELSNLGSLGELFDTEEVRVSRGPQGFRGGASAIAGRIELFSPRPAPTAARSGIATVGAGSASRVRMGAAAEGALSSDLAVRGSLSQSTGDGSITNSFLDRDDTNGTDFISQRMRFTYTPSSDTDIDLLFLRSDQENGYDAFTIDNTRTTRSDRPGRDDQSLLGALLSGTQRINKDFFFLSRASVTRGRQRYSYDGDWGNNPFWGTFAPYDYFSEVRRLRRTRSVEVGLGTDPKRDPFVLPSFQTGVYLSRLTEHSTQEDDFSGELYNNLDSRFVDTRRALYLSATTPVLTDTTIGIGGRLEQQRFTYEDSQESAGRDTHDELFGELTLAHRIAEDTVITTRLANGFRGGGVNPGTRIRPQERGYRPERLTTLEAGVSTSSPDAWWRGSVNSFYNWRSGQQLQTSRQDDPTDPLAFTYLITNADDGHGYGVEAEWYGELTSTLSVYATGALLVARSTGVDGRGERDVAHAPRWQYAVGGKYNLSPEWFIRADLTGRDAFYYGENHNEKSEPYALLGAALGYDDGTWAVTLYGRNILDERYGVRGYYFGVEPPEFANKLYIQRGDPAQVGVTVSYRF